MVDSNNEYLKETAQTAAKLAGDFVSGKTPGRLTLEIGGDAEKGVNPHIENVKLEVTHGDQTAARGGAKTR